MKHNDFMTKNKSKVLKLQSFVGEDKCMNKRFRKQMVKLAFANLHELFIRGVLPSLFFLVETIKLRIWFNFVLGSRKTNNLTFSYFSFYLARSESTRSICGSYDFHIFTALAAATKCCEWYFKASTRGDKKALFYKYGKVPCALKSVARNPKGLLVQYFNHCCPLCLNRRVSPTLLMTSGYVKYNIQYFLFIL